MTCVPGPRCVTSRAVARAGAARAGRRPAPFLSLQAFLPNRFLYGRGARRSAALWPLQYRARWGITLTRSEVINLPWGALWPALVVFTRLSPSTPNASSRAVFSSSKLEVSFLAAVYVLRDEYIRVVRSSSLKS